MKAHVATQYWYWFVAVWNIAINRKPVQGHG